MGFIFLPTVVRAYKETGIEKYRQAGITAARMLLKRFNIHGNFIKAWGALSDTSNQSGWMIIDTMLNLELLFWAWQETGEVEFYDIAYKHAITCLKENVRPDFSSYHVIEFNPKTGIVEKRELIRVGKMKQLGQEDKLGEFMVLLMHINLPKMKDS